MSIQKIVLPVRPQPDTIIAIYFLRRYGTKQFPGVDTATLSVDPHAQVNAPEYKDAILIDVGGGMFDHHGQTPPTTASALIARTLGIISDPSISKLLRFAERDDMRGLGTISKDQLDRAFGLSGLITAMNKTHAHDSQKVVDAVIPLIQAHHEEEIMRVHELPATFAALEKDGKITIVSVGDSTGPLRAVLIESDNISMPSYLRSQAGGRFDIVIQRRETGHINILSKPRKQEKIPLERLVAVIRGAEYYMRTGNNIEKPYAELTAPAKIEEVPNWYYDPATNSIQNGGIHTDLTPATEIPWQQFPKMLELAFNAKE